MLKFYVVVKKNKNGEGNHAELRVNLGYAEKVVSFDRATIAEILGIPIKELATAETGEQWEIELI